MDSKTALEILAPIIAMSGGQDFDRGETGALVTATYIQIIERYSVPIAREGVLRACRASAREERGWRPGPEKVRDCCEAELAQLATEYFERSKVIMFWTPAEQNLYASLSDEDAWPMFEKRYEETYGVNYREMRETKDPLVRARKLRGWSEFEIDAPSSAELMAPFVDEALKANTRKLLASNKLGLNPAQDRPPLKKLD